MKNNIEGFTLIELLIVIAIIGILAAVLIPNLLGAQKRAYDTGAQGCAKSLQTAQATMQIDKQGYFGASKAKGDTVLTYTIGSLAAAPAAGTVDGISSSCLDKNIIIATTGTTTGADYTMTVKDDRGSKTYAITPSGLTGS
ncbi:type IV pilin protein [Deinococcus marmoris]|uniref:type IV pilin protein n=1 Tax=Deinococcus marmoris TaxID=249408 RepID=UPI000495899E|nr:type II secretion system protein [Deinococcus marmoris]